MRLFSSALTLYLAVSHVISSSVSRPSTGTKTGVKTISGKGTSVNSRDFLPTFSSPKVKRQTNSGEGEKRSEDRPISLPSLEQALLVSDIDYKIMVAKIQDIDALTTEFSQRYGLAEDKVRELIVALIAQQEERLDADGPLAVAGTPLANYGVYVDPDVKVYIRYVTAIYRDNFGVDVPTFTRLVREFWVTEHPREQEVIQTIKAYEDATYHIGAEMLTRVFDWTPTADVVEHFVERFGLDKDWTLLQVSVYYQGSNVLGLLRIIKGEKYNWYLPPELLTWINAEYERNLKRQFYEISVSCTSQRKYQQHRQV